MRISCPAALDSVMNDPGSVLCLDIETTGLSRSRDEVLSLAIIDGADKVRFHSYFRPDVLRTWPEAQRVHGISPEDVDGCPGFSDLSDVISDTVSDASVIVSYNGIGFDIPFLKTKGVDVPDVPLCDVMLDFAPIYGEWNPWRNDYKWQKLVTCASYYNYTFSAHDALNDVRATMFCLPRVAKDMISAEGDH